MILPFSSLSLCAAVIALIFLPETTGKRLLDTIEEVEGTASGSADSNSHETRPLKDNISPPLSPKPDS